jgi:perosamine synthetase
VSSAVAVVNGTAALHVALVTAGVGAGDEVVVPALTFVASANAVRHCGAWPVFVDVDPAYWQLDVGRLQELIEERFEHGADGQLQNRHSGRRLKAIMPVHLLGHPVDMDALLDVARQYELVVVEDAAESLGARYRGRPVGGLGDVGCFSFNGNKTITAGGGGALVTNDAHVASRARYLTTQAREDGPEYIHGEVGFNYRLTNIQAALACAQLELLDSFLERKRDIAERYARAFQDVPGIQLMQSAPWAEPAFWLNTILVDESRFGRDSRALMGWLAERGIESRPLWQPLHRSPAHAGADAGPIVVADALYANALSLPSSVGMDEAQQQRVIDAVAEASGV